MINWSDYLTYNPEDGNLLWKERPISCFTNERIQKTWNTRYAGTPAGFANILPSGLKDHIRIELDGKTYSAARVIWEMHYGPISDGMIPDHINGNRSDNRLSNLRLATISQNAMNSKRPNTNTTGLKGTTFNKASGKYVAQIKKEGKTIHLGYFETADQAHAAYRVAGVSLHGEFFRPA